jgi:hypothetical protein
MKIASLSGTHNHSGSALIIIPILFFFLDTLYFLIYILLNNLSQGWKNHGHRHVPVMGSSFLSKE